MKSRSRYDSSSAAGMGPRNPTMFAVNEPVGYSRIGSISTDTPGQSTDFSRRTRASSSLILQLILTGVYGASESPNATMSAMLGPGMQAENSLALLRVASVTGP